MASPTAPHFRAVCTVVLAMLWLSGRPHVLASAATEPHDHDHDHGHGASPLGDPFEDVLALSLTLDSVRNISYAAADDLLEVLFHQRLHCEDVTADGQSCGQCLSADTLFSIVGAQPALGLDEELFNRACVVLLHYVSEPEVACANFSLEYAHYEREVQTSHDNVTALSEEELEAMLDSVALTYEPLNYAQCFDVESVFEAAVADHEAGAVGHEVEAVAALVLSSLFRGLCMGNATQLDPDAFLEDIFAVYATDEGAISEDKFIEILGILAIGGDEAAAPADPHDHAHRRRRREARDPGARLVMADPHGHDHDHDHGHDHDHDHGHDHHHGHGHGHGHDHGHDHHHHHGHGHQRRRRGAPDPGARLVAAVAAEAREHRRRRAAEGVHDHADHEGAGDLDVHRCFSVDELLEMVHANHSVGVTREEFTQLSPVLIQQAISGACAHVETTSSPIRPTSAQVWGYGFLSVAIISVCAVIGVCFLPCLHTNVYALVLQTMMALAVSTLVGDAVLHLIPQAVGLHAHDVSSGDSHASHGVGSEELAYVWKCLVVVAAVYVFFLFESAMNIFGGGHSHSVQPDGDPTSRKRASSSLAMKEAVNGSFRKSTSKTHLESAEENGGAYEDPEERRPYSAGRKKTCWGMGSLPFMIFIGDGLHNLGDGLAIGAAFATSIGAGVSTSIAVFCHELPHELGDFAVLLNSGLTFRKAVCVNVLSAMMAFVGLCIGIPLAVDQGAREWIFAVAAGMFLYVALVDMLPEVIHHDLKGKGFVFLLHNVGFLMGAGIMLVIALYEDQINISL